MNVKGIAVKTKKNGDPAISREVWLHRADCHDSFCEGLLWLVERSLESARGTASDENFDAEYQQSSITLKRLMRLRARAEGAEPEESGREASSVGTEYLRLIDCLLSWAKSEAAQSKSLTGIAHNVRRGRPTASAAGNYNSLFGFGKSKVASADKRRRGRKSAAQISDEQLLLLLSSARKQKRKDIDVLRVFAASELQRQGKHTAGRQVELIASNLQKRASAARLRRSEIELNIQEIKSQKDE